MKLFIQKIGDGWGEPTYRGDLDSTPREQYNAQGIYDLEPTAGPECDFNMISTHQPYLGTDGVVRYRWTTTVKTGEALAQAVRDKWHVVRATRLQMLQASDYTQLTDASMSPEVKSAWVAYRQALRDITLQADPFNIVWPASPDGRVPQIGVVRV